MTSNAGARLITENKNSLGFSDMSNAGADVDKIKEMVIKYVPAGEDEDDDY